MLWTAPAIGARAPKMRALLRLPRVGGAIDGRRLRQYLEHTTPKPALWPLDPVTRARAVARCRRQIEKSPLAPIEMSLSPVFESDGELAADDGDFDEPFGDRSDERFARSGRRADQGF